MKKVLIAGHYGFGNAGDELILTSILEGLRRESPDVQIDVVSGDPETTSREHGTGVIYVSQIERMVRSIRESDLVIVGGGGLFHDYWGFDPASQLTRHHTGIAYATTFALLCNILETPLMIYAVGVGPLLSPEGREQTLANFQLSSLATVRDRGSLDALLELGLAEGIASVSADPVFRLSLPSSAGIAAMPGGDEDSPVLGVALRQWDVGVEAGEWPGEVAQAIDKFIDATGARVLLVPFQQRAAHLSDDVQLAHQIIGEMRSPERTSMASAELSAIEKAGLIAGCDLVLGMRKHSLISAALGNVPAVALAYDPKVSAVMQAIGCEEYSLPLDRLETGRLFERLEQAWLERDALRRRIEPAVDRLRAAAEEDVARAKQALYQPPELPLLKGEAARVLAKTALSHASRTESLTLRTEEMQEYLQVEANRFLGEIEALRRENESLSARLEEAGGLFSAPGAAQLGRRVKKGLKDVLKRSGEAQMPAHHNETSQLAPRPFEALPLVSIVLPVFDQADLLAEAIPSVLSQSYPHIELIVVDDGSTDDVLGAVRGAGGDPRVRVLRQPNQKLPRALSHGFQHARGDLLTWTSADNILLPDAIALLVRDLLANPASPLAYGDVALIDESGNLLQDPGGWAPKADADIPYFIRFPRNDLPLGYERDNFVGSYFLYRREASGVLAHRYADELIGVEDYDFWLRIQRCGPLHHARNPQPLYRYRQHTRSMTTELHSTERSAFERRTRQRLEIEPDRRIYCAKRWRLAIDGSVATIERDRLIETAQQVAVDIVEGPESWDPQSKTLPVLTEGIARSSVAVRLSPRTWKLEWSEDAEAQSVELFRGYMVDPLATKARTHWRSTWEYPRSEGRRIVGCHLDLSSTDLDEARMRELMFANPSIYFALIDTGTGGNHHPMFAGIQNVSVVESEPMGRPYPKYACFDAWFLPPTQGPIEVSDYQQQLMLAYATSRPMLVPVDQPIPTAPYQFRYTGEVGLGAVLDSATAERVDEEILDRYLDEWSPTGCLRRLLHYADALTQGWAVPDPDTGINPPPVTAPVELAV